MLTLNLLFSLAPWVCSNHWCNRKRKTSPHVKMCQSIALGDLRIEGLLKEHLTQILHCTGEETEARKDSSGHRKIWLQSQHWNSGSRLPSPASHRVPLDDFLIFLQFSLWADTFSQTKPQTAWKEHWVFLYPAYFQPPNADSFSLSKSSSEDTLWWDFSFTEQLNPGFFLMSSATPKWLWVKSLQCSWEKKWDFLPFLASFLAPGSYPGVRHLKFWCSF